jgi:hypothetical protein
MLAERTVSHPFIHASSTDIAGRCSAVPTLNHLVLFLLFASLGFGANWNAESKACLEDLHGSVEALSAMMAVDNMDLRTLTDVAEYIRSLTLPKMDKAMTAMHSDITKLGDVHRKILEDLSVLVQAATRSEKDHGHSHSELPSVKQQNNQLIQHNNNNNNVNTQMTVMSNQLTTLLAHFGLNLNPTAAAAAGPHTPAVAAAGPSAPAPAAAAAGPSAPTARAPQVPTVATTVPCVPRDPSHCLDIVL